MRILALIITICTCFTAIAQDDSLSKSIDSLLAHKSATVGVAILKCDNSYSLGVNSEERLPMQSVFKFHIALAVLDRVDKGELTLDRRLSIPKSSLLPNTWSPIRDKYPNGTDSLSVAQVIEYTVAMSDNNGCDILLRLIGGTRSVEQYLREMGIKDVAIKVNEEQMQEDWETQFRNWTTPKSAAALLCNFNNGKLLSTDSRQFLFDIMANTSTGGKRLKGLLPQGTLVAHKTGTSGTRADGLTSAINDIGIVTLPDGTEYAIAVMVCNSMESNETNEAIVAEISKLAWDYLSIGG